MLIKVLLDFILGVLWREGSSDANGELFKEDDDKAMLKGPYEI